MEGKGTSHAVKETEAQLLAGTDWPGHRCDRGSDSYHSRKKHITQALATGSGIHFDNND